MDEDKDLALDGELLYDNRKPNSCSASLLVTVSSKPSNPSSLATAAATTLDNTPSGSSIAPGGCLSPSPVRRDKSS